MFKEFFPRSVPRIVRIIATASFIGFAVIGLLVSVQALKESIFAFFLSVLFFAVLGALLSAGITVLCMVLIGIGSKNAEARMDTLFSQRGWCEELWQTADRGHVFPTDDDQVCQLFCRVMAEDYEGAAKLANAIIEDDLPMRSDAMLITARMQMYAMTDRMDMAHKLFDRHHLKMETAYANQPELFRFSHAYADDALQFGRLAAAMSVQTGNYADAEKYAHLVDFQLTRATPGSAKLYPLLMQVEQLYAEKKLSDGDLAAAAFRGMLQSGEVQLLPGERANFLRAADQAKLFARYNPQGNSQMTERKMPGMAEKPGMDDGLTAM